MAATKSADTDVTAMKTTQSGGDPEWLLRLRLWFYGACSLHFLLLGAALLSIDYEAHGDDRIVMYKDLRFKLLTIWANLMHLTYFPLCWWLAWQDCQGTPASNLTKTLQKFRSIWFTSILFPTTAYVCSFFWRMWLLDRELLVPSYCDRILPLWAQHGLHTDTILFCAAELLLTRWKPEKLTRQRWILNLFIAAYLATGVWSRLISGRWMYPFLDQLVPWQMALFCLSLWLEHMFWFHVQWWISELVGGTHRLQRSDVLKGQ